jgi:flagellin
MASINTNVAAMTALRSLTATNSALTQTQERISTGLRVATAADNAAYWSIATTMKSDNSSLSTVQDALGLGAAFVDVAYTALDEAKNIVTKIKDKLVAAAQPGLDRAKIQTEVTELQAQLTGMAGAATLQGQNWLSVDSAAPSRCRRSPSTPVRWCYSIRTRRPTASSIAHVTQRRVWWIRQVRSPSRRSTSRP